MTSLYTGAVPGDTLAGRKYRKSTDTSMVKRRYLAKIQSPILSLLLVPLLIIYQMLVLRVF